MAMGMRVGSPVAGGGWRRRVEGRRVGRSRPISSPFLSGTLHSFAPSFIFHPNSSSFIVRRSSSWVLREGVVRSVDRVGRA